MHAIENPHPSQPHFQQSKIQYGIYLTKAYNAVQKVQSETECHTMYIQMAKCKRKTIDANVVLGFLVASSGFFETVFCAREVEMLMYSFK